MRPVAVAIVAPVVAAVVAPVACSSRRSAPAARCGRAAAAACPARRVADDRRAIAVAAARSRDRRGRTGGCSSAPGAADARRWRDRVRPLLVADLRRCTSAAVRRRRQSRRRSRRCAESRRRSSTADAAELLRRCCRPLRRCCGCACWRACRAAAALAAAPGCALREPAGALRVPAGARRDRCRSSSLVAPWSCASAGEAAALARRREIMILRMTVTFLKFPDSEMCSSSDEPRLNRFGAVYSGLRSWRRRRWRGLRGARDRLADARIGAAAADVGQRRDLLLARARARLAAARRSP